MNFFNHPSVLAHTANGALFILAIILVSIYYTSLNKVTAIIIVLLFSIAVGIHGLSHLGLEYVYGYSPYKIFSEEFQVKNYCPCPMRPGGCPMRPGGCPMRSGGCPMRGLSNLVPPRESIQTSPKLYLPSL
jgi:hypothetical protein